MQIWGKDSSLWQKRYDQLMFAYALPTHLPSVCHLHLTALINSNQPRHHYPNPIGPNLPPPSPANLITPPFSPFLIMNRVGRIIMVLPSSITRFAFLSLLITNILINNMQEEGDLEGARVSQLGACLRGVATRLSGRWYFRCEICLQELENHECSSYANCTHQRNFCLSCLEKYFRFKLLFYEEIRCPREGCHAPIDITTPFFTTLPQHLQRRYRKIRQSYEKLHDANFRSCPEETCEGNIVYNGEWFECSACMRRFCLNCLSRQHKGECYREELAFFQNIFHFRRCPRCKFVVEKSMGCDHITCLCKYQFCYRCGEAYTRLHACKTNSAINPPPVQASKHDQPEHLSKPSLLENVYLGVSLVVVLIPLFAFFAAAFLLWATAITLKELVKTTFILLLLVVLGAGPYACQVSKRCGKKGIVALLLGYPVLMVVGVRQCFLELFLFALTPLWRRYKHAVRKCWKAVFVDSICE